MFWSNVMRIFRIIAKNVLPYFLVRKIQNKNVCNVGNENLIDWKTESVCYNSNIITLKTVYTYINSFCKKHNLDKSYYESHALRFFVTLVYIIKNKLHEGRILEVGGKIDFFAYLLKLVLGVEDITHVENDLRKPLELDENQFDVIICMEVFEHLIDSDAFDWFTFKGVSVMLNSFWKILKDNGKLLITTPNSIGVLSMSRLLESQSPLMFVFHAREYTPSELKTIIEASGYSIDILDTECVWGGDQKNRMLNILASNGYSLKLRGDDIFLIAKKIKNFNINSDVNINKLIM
jgi:SAM-dependent methyltransferase